MRKLEELLEDYKSGLLSPEEERFVEEQLTEKPELLEEAQAIAFVWEAVKQQVKQDEKEKLKARLLEDTELRKEYEGELQKHLTTEDSEDPEKEKKIVPVVPAKTRKKWHPAYPIAASIIGLLVMVFAFFNPFAQKETTEELASTQLFWLILHISTLFTTNYPLEGAVGVVETQSPIWNSRKRTQLS